jgi:hypothetical protein
MRILLAVDESEYGKAAADSVAARPWPANSVIKVLSAIEPPYYPTTETWILPEKYYSEMESAAKEQAQYAHHLCVLSVISFGLLIIVNSCTVKNLGERLKSNSNFTILEERILLMQLVGEYAKEWARLRDGSGGLVNT